MSENEVRVTGVLAALSPLRTTPAGIAVAEFTIEHQSSRLREGTDMKFEFRLPAVAFGEVARAVLQAGVGRRARLQGCLNATRRGGNRVVLHVERIEYE